MLQKWIFRLLEVITTSPRLQMKSEYQHGVVEHLAPAFNDFSTLKERARDFLQDSLCG